MNDAPFLKRAWGWGVSALLFAVFFLRLLVLPATVVDDTHDLSSHATFEYYFEHGFQWGVDVIQNVGPLGFLHYADSYAGIVRGRLVFEFLWAAVLAAMILSARRLFGNAGYRAVWLLAVFAALSAEESLLRTEVAPYLFLVLTAYFLFTEEARGPWRPAHVLFMLGLAVLSLMKSAHFTLSLALVGAYAVQKAMDRDLRPALANLLCFGLFLAATWVLAGQRLANFPRFARSVFAFTSGYSEGMTFYEHPLMTLLGAGLGVFLLAACAYRLARSGLRGTGLCGFLAFCTFVAWKHGFVRADVHMYTFLDYVLFASVPVFLADRPDRPAGPGALERRGRLYAYLLCLALCWAPLSLDYGPSPVVKFRQGVDEIRARLAALRHYPAYVAALDQRLEDNRRRMALDSFRPIVGDARVDCLGKRPAALVLGGFNYRSRPMPISFATFNEELLRRNAEFFADPRTAPDYVVAQIDTIDRRLVAQDDSMAKREILYRYRPRAEEKDSVLLERRSGAGSPAGAPLGEPRAFRLGEEVPVPDADRGWLWARVDVRYTRLGRLVSFLYKPPRISIELIDERGERRLAKLVPGMARAGFLLEPLIENNADLLRAYGEGQGAAPTPPRVKAFRVVVAKPRARPLVAEDVTVSFERLPSPAAR